MGRVDGEESWVLDVRTGAAFIRGEERILYEAILMKKVESKRLKEG